MDTVNVIWNHLLGHFVFTVGISQYPPPWWVKVVSVFVPILVSVCVLWLLLFVLFPRILRTLKRWCDSVR